MCTVCSVQNGPATYSCPVGVEYSVGAIQLDCFCVRLHQARGARESAQRHRAEHISVERQWSGGGAASPVAARKHLQGALKVPRSQAVVP
jgi:hypothetical protein